MRRSDGKGIRDRATLLAHARAIEQEAAARYDELADMMEVHNNTAVATLFRRLATIERKHVDKVEATGAAAATPRIAPLDYQWTDPEGPETSPYGGAHYLMEPYHALRLALHNEERGVAFFEAAAYLTPDAEVRRLAQEMAAEEHEHVHLVRAWLDKVPVPAVTWDEDLDPPQSVD